MTRMTRTAKIVVAEVVVVLMIMATGDKVIKSQVKL